MEDVKIVEEENIIKEPVKNMPWQISTAGLIVGFFLGLIPLLISLLANHQYKQGKDVSELIKAYNIIFIIMIVFLGIAIFIFLLIFIVALIGAVAFSQ